MKEILLTKNKVALVSDEDYPYLSQFAWHCLTIGKMCYAMRSTPRVNGKHKSILMHREILGVPPDKKVDHKDGDGLNNVRDNLRPATQMQNAYNQAAPSTNTSGYKGVNWFARYGKWRARISINGRVKHLGYFDSIKDAALARDNAARDAHGEFAYPSAKLEKKRCPRCLGFRTVQNTDGSLVVCPRCGGQGEIND